MLWCSKYLEREVPPSEMKTGCRWPRLWSHAGEQRCFRPGAKIQQRGSPAAPAAPRRRPATRSAFYTLRYRRHEANAAVSACWCVRADYRIWRLTEHEQNRTCVFTAQLELVPIQNNVRPHSQLGTETTYCCTEMYFNQFISDWFDVSNHISVHQHLNLYIQELVYFYFCF